MWLRLWFTADWPRQLRTKACYRLGFVLVCERIKAKRCHGIGHSALDGQLQRVVATGQRNRADAYFTNLMRSQTDTRKPRLRGNIVETLLASQPSHSLLALHGQLHRVVASGQRNRADADFSHLMWCQTDTSKPRLGRLLGHQHSRDALRLSPITQPSSSSRSAAPDSCYRTKESCGRGLFAPHAEPDGYGQAATRQVGWCAQAGPSGHRW